MSIINQQFAYHIVGNLISMAPYKLLGADMGIWYIFTESAFFPADSFFSIGNWVLHLDKKRQQGIKKVNIHETHNL